MLGFTGYAVSFFFMPGVSSGVWGAWDQACLLYLAWAKSLAMSVEIQALRGFAWGQEMGLEEIWGIASLCSQ